MGFKDAEKLDIFIQNETPRLFEINDTTVLFYKLAQFEVRAFFTYHLVKCEIDGYEHKSLFSKNRNNFQYNILRGLHT